MYSTLNYQKYNVISSCKSWRIPFFERRKIVTDKEAREELVLLQQCCMKDKLENNGSLIQWSKHTKHTRQKTKVSSSSSGVIGKEYSLYRIGFFFSRRREEWNVLGFRDDI